MPTAPDLPPDVAPPGAAAAFEAVQGLPTVALVLLGAVLAPILLLELVLGLWLLVKGAAAPAAPLPERP